MIVIKELSEKELPSLMLLSAKIFSPILQGLDKSKGKNIWIENYGQKSLVLGAYNDKALVGFLFFYEQVPQIKTIHWWMDGVDEQFRQQGILTSLMQKGLEEVKRRGYEYVTVNTFPEKFPVMFSFLQNHGFTQYKEEQKDWSGHEVKKVFFRKKL